MVPLFMVLKPVHILLGQTSKFICVSVLLLFVLVLSVNSRLFDSFSRRHITGNVRNSGAKVRIGLCCNSIRKTQRPGIAS